MPRTGPSSPRDGQFGTTGRSGQTDDGSTRPVEPFVDGAGFSRGRPLASSGIAVGLAYPAMRASNMAVRAPELIHGHIGPFDVAAFQHFVLAVDQTGMCRGKGGAMARRLASFGLSEGRPKAGLQQAML
jgi:hypothetical protein